MNGILRGLKNNEVVMLQGDNKRDLIQEFVQKRFACVFFSVVGMDLKRVATSLGSRPWDGSACPVVVLYRCEQWMRELAPLIRNRQSKQAVLLVSDGVYTPETPLMKSLVTLSIVSGRLGPTVFSGLAAGRPSRVSRESKEPAGCTPHPLRYKGAIACSDLDTVIDQIHHATADSLETADANKETLADIDVLRYNVPGDVLSHCLPILPGITYKSQAKSRKHQIANMAFAATLSPLVTKATGSMMSLHDTLEYVRGAHQIQISPQVVQYPRDDNDPLLVTNANDKIRVLVCPTLFRRIPVAGDPDEALFGHPVEQARLEALAYQYTGTRTTIRKRQRIC